MSYSDAKCGYCNHSRKDHCKGGVKHTEHKEDARTVASEWRKRNVIYKSTHCEQPLCDCLEFEEP